MRGRIKKIVVLICIIALLLPFSTTSLADGGDNGVNRFNVVLLLDASGSMTRTDPNGYRYEALEQFVFMLADSGNYVGAVVFDTNIEAENAVSPIMGNSDKETVVNTLESFQPNHGDTNIGMALQRSVEMLEENGNPNLPSVIVFVSDGNTDLPTEEEMSASLEAKADAIEQACVDGIEVYTVCLNANGEADTSEMIQISSATGGVFNEIQSAEDLQNTLTDFYGLIYNTIPNPIDETFGPDGVIAKEFDIPGIGVEEVNFVIYGDVSEINVKNSAGNLYNTEEYFGEECAMSKVYNPEAGKITVEFVGTPGTRVCGNLVYNVNLSIVTSTNLDSNDKTGWSTEPVEFSAVLGTGTEMASSDEEYYGYSAELVILNAYDEELKRVPMTLNNAQFTVSELLDSGTYKYRVDIAGINLEKSSDIEGPFILIVPSEPEPVSTPTPVVNQPPIAKEETVTYKKYLIAFMDNTLEIPLEKLAEDPENEKLIYVIDSSSFMKADDYVYDEENAVISLHHYSLSTGSFDVRAIDPGGLCCEIHIVVKSIDVVKITAIVLGILAVLFILAVAIVAYILKGIPLRGQLTVRAADGQESTIEGGHGQIKLRRFIPNSMNAAGFDINKSYFQCTGKGKVIFKSNKKFQKNSGRDKVKKIEVRSNRAGYVVVKMPNSDYEISFQFVSRNTTQRRAARKAPTRQAPRRQPPRRRD